jgi:hypothetical protein
MQTCYGNGLIYNYYDGDLVMIDRSWKPQNASFWYLIPVALGLHGLLLSAPIALEEAPPEKPPTAPVKMQRLLRSKVAASPPLSSSPNPAAGKVAVLPKPIASLNPATKQVIASPPPISLPTPAPKQVAVSPPPIASPAPTAQKVTASPPPIALPPITEQVTALPTPPVPSTPATPPQTPDVFQIQGATSCDNIKDCYASTDTNGRNVALALQAKLQAQGYTLQEIELEEDTGMKVYHLFKNGQPQDYLHIIWTDQGTRSLRLPQPEKSRYQLALKVQL